MVSRGRPRFSKRLLGTIATCALAAGLCGSCGQLLGVDVYTTASPATDAGPSTPSVPPCGATEAPGTDAGCLAAGTSSCPQGFAADGHGGCEYEFETPSACPSEIEVNAPGDHCTLQNCGSSSPPGYSEYVDASSSSNPDGTLEHPWKTIGDAINNAPDGGRVYVASSNGATPVIYNENVVLDRSVGLFGSCMGAEIHGVDATKPTVTIQAATTGSASQIQGLAITGGSMGVLVSGSSGPLPDGGVAPTVSLSRLGIHDVGGPGIVVSDVSASIDGTSIRSVTEAGLLVTASEDATPIVTMTNSAIENVGPTKGGDRGWGAAVLTSPGPYKLASTPSLTIEGSRLVGCRDKGVYASGANLTVTGSVIEQVTPRAGNGSGGIGIVVERYELGGTFTDPQGTGGDATLRLTSSEIASVGSAGVALTDVKTALIEDSTILHVAGVTSGDEPSHCLENGIGVLAVAEASDATDAGFRFPSRVTVEHSLIDGARTAGIELEGVSATVNGVVIRGTAPAAQRGCREVFGDGVVVDATNVATDLALTGSRIDGSGRAALARFGSTGTVTADGVAIGCSALGLAADAQSSGIVVREPSSIVCDCKGRAHVCGVTTEVLASGLVGRP